MRKHWWGLIYFFHKKKNTKKINIYAKDRERRLLLLLLVGALVVMNLQQTFALNIASCSAILLSCAQRCVSWIQDTGNKWRRNGLGEEIGLANWLTNINWPI